VASRRFKVALAVGGVACVVLAVFGPLVRYEATRVAGRYGGSVDIEVVRPTWHGVTLRGVDVVLEGVPSARIHLDEIDVSLGLEGRSVELRGGKIVAIGPREEVVRQLEAWRARHRAPSGEQADTASSTSSMPVEIAGLDVAWRDRADGPSESVTARNVKFARFDGGVKISAESAVLGLGPSSVAIKAGQITLARRKEGGYRISALSAGAVDAEIALPPGEADQAEKQPESKLGSPDPGREKERGASADVAPRWRGPALQRRLMAAAMAVDASLEEGAKIALSGVNARILRGSEALHLGPGDLSVKREAAKLVVELSPGGSAAASPAEGEQLQKALTFRLIVPIGEKSEAGQEIEADVRGGPIWLSTLGVREGDFGLFDVGSTSLVTRSHLVLSASGKEIRIDGDGTVQNLSIRSAALSEEPIQGLDVTWQGKAELALDGSRLKVDEGEVDLGAIHVKASGLYEKVGSAHRVRAEFDVPLAGCQAMLSSIPRGLAPKLQGMQMAGSFALRGKAQFDTARLDRDFKLEWDVSSSCRVTEAPPDIKADRFRKPFRRVAFGVGGERVEIESGPQSPGWVSYGSISKFMEVAVLTTEDGGFFRHHGFDHEAIKNSIRENLRKRRFVRGASTISMQLAKNLYLDKTKNLSRKLQEAVLTMYLEQELTKEQLIELYLNVVEFGPMVYGIGHAARHYFNASASELSLGQALYMASILPNPKVQHFAAGGALSDGWTKYLRKLMHLAHGRKRVSDEELEEGLREIVVRGSPAPLRAPADESGPPAEDPSKDDTEPQVEPAE
jgi:hypothetical protein